MYICKWIICSQWKDCNWKNTSVCDLSSQMVALFVQLLPLHNSLNYPFHHSYIIQNILYSIVLYCMCVLTKWILIDFDKPFICCFHQVIVRQLMNIVLTPNPWFFSFSVVVVVVVVVCISAKQRPIHCSVSDQRVINLLSVPVMNGLKLLATNKMTYVEAINLFGTLIKKKWPLFLHGKCCCLIRAKYQFIVNFV